MRSALSALRRRVDGVKLSRMAKTDYNRVASRAIRRARDESGMNQAEFSAALSDLMGLKGKGRWKQSTLSGWELGNRSVPASTLIAAAELAGISIEAALGHQGSGDLALRVADLAEYVANSAPKMLGKKGDGPDERRVRELAASIRAIVKR
jgi:transcriptional regulator with XRE-family HTH domain